MKKINREQELEGLEIGRGIIEMITVILIIYLI